MNAPLPKAGTAVAALKVNIPALQMDEADLVRVLQNSIYPGAEMASIKLVIGWCKAQNKDPLKRPVHIVPMQVKVKKEKGEGTVTVKRDVLMPGIGDYRTDAARTGEYAGIGEATFGPEITETLGGEPKMKWDDAAREKVATSQKHETLQFKYPEWCEISVFRMVQGVRCEFSSGKVYFKEIYATASNESSLPNAMWKKRPRGQLEKCAEAMALRRAFPEVGAQPTADELEGKVLDEATVIDGAEARRISEAPARPQPEAYPDDQFTKNFPAWEGLIKSGKKTADEIINTVSSKAVLTDGQKESIRAVKKLDSVPSVNVEQLAERMRAAKDMDILAADADLIASVADPEKRKELTAIYQTRRDELAE